jgi:hypothetical protein
MSLEALSKAMNAMLPSVGFDWIILGSGGSLYNNICTYSAQFESIASRWEESDFVNLQPLVPGPGFGIGLAHAAVEGQRAAKREQALLFRRLECTVGPPMIPKNPKTHDPTIQSPTKLRDLLTP